MKKKNTTDFIPFSDLSSHYLEPVAWYRLPFTSRYKMKPHKHPQYEIMYCEQGSFTVDLYRNDHTVLASATVTEKSFILLNNTLFHRLYINTADAELINVELLPVASLPDDANPMLKKLAFSASELFLLSPPLNNLLKKNEPYYVFHDSQEVNYTMRKCIRALFKSNNPEEDLSIRLMITELFMDISNCWLDENSTPLTLSYIKKALLYIQRNFNKPITVNGIAKIVGITPTHLQRLFQAKFNKSVHDVITNIRTEKAKILLRDTSFNNTEIAKLTGFGSRQNLIAAIKKHENCSPQSFRQVALQKQWATRIAPDSIVNCTVELDEPI